MKISRQSIVGVIELLEYTGKKKVTLSFRRYDLTCSAIRNGWCITFSAKPRLRTESKATKKVLRYG